MKAERITTAQTGETIPMRLRYDGQTHTHTVLAPCDLKDNGRWYCVTHLTSFDNQAQKDSHIAGHDGGSGRAKHKLVWLCFAHGPEQP